MHKKYIKMGFLKNSFLKGIVFLLVYPCLNAFSQYVEKTGSQTFYYGGVDAEVDKLNYHNVYYTGFSNSLVAIYDDISLPVLPTLYFEYKYLIIKKNNYINVSANIQPHVALTNFFLFRLPSSVNLNFFNEANTVQKNGWGLSFGAGYEFLTSTFHFHEASPFLQFGFKIDNVKIQYQYKTAQQLIVNHCITAGVQLDF